METGQEPILGARIHTLDAPLDHEFVDGQPLGKGLFPTSSSFVHMVSEASETEFLTNKKKTERGLVPFFKECP